MHGNLFNKTGNIGSNFKKGIKNMKKFIIGNWKCNPTTEKKAKQLFYSIKKGLKNRKDTEIIICPPFCYLGILNNNLSFIKLGAQNCFFEDKGAYTGEISCEMLKSLKCKYVIIGHSERRKIFGETDEMINKKIKKALKSGLESIFCIGETMEEKDQGKTFKILETEMRKGLEKVSKKEIEKIIIAYEPIWAIGSNNSCAEDQAMTVALFIRKLISRLYNKQIAKKIRILYGGSVNSQNAFNYLKNSEIQGLLIGGASLKAKEFIEISNKH